MLSYDRQTKPGLVALYDIQPGNKSSYFYNPGARTGLTEYRKPSTSANVKFKNRSCNLDG